MLYLAPDILTERGKDPDETKLKNLTKEILGEKIGMLQQLN